MNKTLTELKDYLMDIHTTSYIQLSNYFILVALAIFIKILAISIVNTEFFTTGFELSVFAFMMIWLILRALHSFNMLQGYYSFAGIFVLLYILIGSLNIYLINVSMAIVVIGRIFEVKELFAKGRKGDAE